MSKISIIILIGLIIISCQTKKEEKMPGAIFKFGYKAGTSSTGPLNNSGFIFKLRDSIPPFFLSAHHTVAGTGVENVYLKWDSLQESTKNIFLWNMQDINYGIPVDKNLPVPNGETLKLDVSCFYLPSDTFSYITPAKQAAKIGDSVNLFSRLVYNGDTTFINPAMVVYATDSVLVYELLNFKAAQVMNGTSGSPVLNQSGELVSNSYAGLTLPSEEEKEKLTKLFPVIARYPLQIGKTYGMGVPVKWIEASLFEAIQLEKASKK